MVGTLRTGAVGNRASRRVVAGYELISVINNVRQRRPLGRTPFVRLNREG